VSWKKGEEEEKRREGIGKKGWVYMDNMATSGY